MSEKPATYRHVNRVEGSMRKGFARVDKLITSVDFLMGKALDRLEGSR